MSMLDRIFGKRARTAAIIAAEIEGQRAAIAASETAIVEAQAARQAAIEAFDDAKHRGADEAAAAARRDIERREHAIGLLTAAYGERVEVEAREAFRREVEEAARAGQNLAKRFGPEYEAAAEKIAALLTELAAASHQRRLLVKRGQELGEEIEAYNIGPDGIVYAVGNIPSIDGSGRFVWYGRKIS